MTEEEHPRDTEIIPAVLKQVSTLVLKPGDYLAIHVAESIHHEQLRNIKESVDLAWPEINTLIFAGNLRLTRITKEEVDEG